MKTFVLLSGMLFGSVLAIEAIGAEELKSVPIPLNEIWAYRVPGTRDVRELEPKPKLAATIDEMARHSDVFRILKALDRRPKEGKKAGPAFVVVGTGKQALKNAAAVFGAYEEAPINLPPQTDLSLIFFSYESGLYLHLVNIERLPGQITLKYRLVRHGTQILTRHFALIPLGKLTEGMVQVKVEQLPTVDEAGRSARTVRDPLQFVSGSFSFNVEKK